MLRAIAFFSARPKTFSATASAGAVRRPKNKLLVRGALFGRLLEMLQIFGFANLQSAVL